MSSSLQQLTVTLTLLARHYGALARILRSTPRHNSLLSLTSELLKERGVRVLALDFDGVLAPHGAVAPLPEVQEWLCTCAVLLGEDRLFIVSNKPSEIRRQWFQRHFPAIRFITGVQKKPSPEGLLRIIMETNVVPSTILMVDDRLLTGCLAALESGVEVSYIRKPYYSFKLHPLAELFFMGLRGGERLLMRLAPG